MVKIFAMHKCIWSLLLLLCTTFCHAGDDKGFCPAAHRISKAAKAATVPRTQALPSGDATFAGTVSLLIVISNKGYVCSVQLIEGFDKVADEKAIQSARQWRFTPSHKDGLPVAVELKVEVAFWRNTNGELVNKQPDQSAK
jgi:TonB family protein